MSLDSLDRKPFLEQLGLVPTISGPVEIEGVIIDSTTLREHRIIAYSTGVLPSSVVWLDDNRSKLLLRVSRAELIREGLSESDLKLALDICLIVETEVEYL